MTRTRIIGIGGLGLALLSIALLAAFWPKPESLTLDLGDLPGADDRYQPRFRSFRKETVLVSAPDGTELAVDYFIPTEPIAGEKQPDSFPTLFSYGPYGRALILTDLPWWQRVGLWFKTGNRTGIFDPSSSKDGRLYLSQGYALVSGDMRGSGASEGSVMQLDMRHGPDGAAVVDWIAKQPWSDGQVCMYGQSYLGWSQIVIAAEAPQALKCIAPSHVFFDAYSGSSRPGGIQADSWLKQYSDYLQAFTDNDTSRGYATAPAVDEDDDGNLLDEVPVEITPDGPVYRDHQRRVGQRYAKVTKEHGGNHQPADTIGPDYDFVDSAIVFADMQMDYQTPSPARILASKIIDTDIAVMNIAGWFDGFGRGGPKFHATLAEHRRSRLFAAPRFHVPGEVTDPYRALLGYQGSYADQLAFEQLRFFDYHLRGIGEGYDEEKPVRLYAAHGGWQEHATWPVPGTKMTSFFLDTDGSLSSSQSEGGQDTFTVDWDHASNYGTNKWNRWLMWGAPDTVMIRNDPDKHSTVYETDPLLADLEVIGHPVASLTVSVNQRDADVFVYLSDVSPEGEAHLVTEGRLRLGFARSPVSNDTQTGGVVDAKPDLPWYNFRRDGYRPAEPGSTLGPVKAEFDLFPTAWVFKKGHRVRVSIAGVDDGNFALNPMLCTESTKESCTETILTIHRDRENPSALVLPVVEGDSERSVKKARAQIK